MTEQLTEVTWETLGAEWRDAPATSAASGSVPSLQRLLARQRRRMLTGLAADVAVTLLFAAFVGWMLLRHPGPATTWLAANVTAMLVAAWGIALWSRRGSWRPLGESTQDFLALARRRSRRTGRALDLSLVLVALQLLFVLVWTRVGPRGPAVGPVPGGRLIAVVAVAVFVAGILVARARVRREVRQLDALAADVQ